MPTLDFIDALNNSIAKSQRRIAAHEELIARERIQIAEWEAQINARTRAQEALAPITKPADVTPINARSAAK